MRLDPNPLFRRMIMPWYDSTPLCWLLMLFMIATVVFSIVGIVVALDSPDYHRHWKIPVLLLAMSLFVGISVSSRLYRRYHQKKRDASEQ